jgi:hypothetical protein
MTTRKRGRLSRREQIESVNRGLRAWGAMFGKPEVAEKLSTQLPVTRAPRHASGRPLERNVLRAVMQALRYDPRVLRVERNQSGVFQDGNRYVRVGSRGKLDLTVYLKSGRYAELEVKRDERTKPDPRQQRRIDEIKQGGGIAGWCWSVESALAILP